MTTQGTQGTQGSQGTQGTQGLQGGHREIDVLVTVPTPITVTVGTGYGGARGIQGVQGTQGPTSAPTLVSFHYTQYAPSAVWNITHNLNFYPNVTTLDSSGSICEGEIDYIDSNSIRITFLASFSGTAYLS
jgi:hypothetical protein